MLRRLDQPDSNVLSWDELEKWPAEEKNRFVRLGLLREIEAARSLFLDECDDQPIATPQWFTDPQTGRTTGRYYCGNPYCESLHFIEPDRMRQWEFGLHALAVAVAVATGVSGRVTVDVGDYSCFVGTVSSAGRPTREVFLTRTAWWKDTPAVCAPDTRLAASNNATLLCVDRMPPMEQRRESWHSILSLAEIASMGDNGLVVPVARVLEDQVLPQRLTERSTDALTQTEIDVLEALAERPKEPQLIAELVAASGYGRDSVMSAVKRLIAVGFLTRPNASARKGVSITKTGIERVGRLPKSA